MATTVEIHDTGSRLVANYPALGNENGDPFSASDYPDKTIQAHGTGTVTLQGSSDGTNWEPLKDSAGVVISIDATTHAAAVVLENTPMMRAVNTAASARVVITCSK